MENIITKKKLSRHDSFPVFAERYIIFEDNGKRRLSVRFFNDRKIEINAMRFTVHQYDDDGNLLNFRIITLGSYSLKSSFIYDMYVAPICASVKIKVESVLSDKSEYVNENDKVTINYGKEIKNVYQKSNKSYNVVYRSKNITMFLRILIIVLFILAFAIVIMSNILPDVGYVQGQVLFNKLKGVGSCYHIRILLTI